jgi:lipopolysaccharide biosynthesis glycosyltransferase
MDLSDIDPRFTPITEKDRLVIDSVLKRKNENSSATLVDFSENFRLELIHSKNMKTGYTPYAMIRLFADECELFGDKLMYLDTDVLLSGDIGEFYDIDLGGYDLAGVRDHYGRFFINPNYLNSGVMLWNLKAIREKGIFRKATKLCNDKKMLLMDQSAINKYAKKKLILPPRFNEQHKNRPDTLIRHFSMRIKWFPYIRTEKIKPWNFELIHEKLKLHCYDDIFEEFKLIKKGLAEDLKESFA